MISFYDLKMFRIHVRTGTKLLVLNDVIQALHVDTTASISGIDTKFDVHSGCRQGGEESPCLFYYISTSY